MDELTKYILSIVATLISAYLSSFLQPKSKVVFWLQHQFLFDITPTPTAAAPNPPRPQLHTHALTVQNAGRKAAEDIEIVHRQKPDIVKLFPALNHTETTSPSGEHIITVKSLAPKEFFNIEYLSFVREPHLLYIRSKDGGHAKSIAVQPQQVFPPWVLTVLRVILYVGIATIIYWLINLGIGVHQFLKTASRS